MAAPSPNSAAAAAPVPPIEEDLQRVAIDDKITEIFDVLYDAQDKSNRQEHKLLIIKQDIKVLTNKAINSSKTLLRRQRKARESLEEYKTMLAEQKLPRALAKLTKTTGIQVHNPSARAKIQDILTTASTDCLQVLINDKTLQLSLLCDNIAHANIVLLSQIIDYLDTSTTINFKVSDTKDSPIEMIIKGALSSLDMAIRSFKDWQAKDIEKKKKDQTEIKKARDKECLDALKKPEPAIKEIISAEVTKMRNQLFADIRARRKNQSRGGAKQAEKKAQVPAPKKKKGTAKKQRPKKKKAPGPPNAPNAEMKNQPTRASNGHGNKTGRKRKRVSFA